MQQQSLAAGISETLLPHADPCRALPRRESASPDNQDHEAKTSRDHGHSPVASSSPRSTNIMVAEVQQKNGPKKRDSASMAGRKHKPSPTIHGWRLHWLIWQLKREGLSEAEIGRRAGLGQTYINAYARIEDTGVSGVSLDVAQKLCDTLGMDGGYWLDRYKGERPYRLYLFDAEKRRIENERLEQKLQEIQLVMSQSERRSEERMAKLEQELRDMRSTPQKVREVPRAREKPSRNSR